MSEQFEPVIGLEVHAQLVTKSKMFCRCSAEYAGAAPNAHVCPICAGMPGALPVINRRAVEGTILTALAFHSTVSENSKFDRKNYSYPDLPKGFQITQYDKPIGLGGWLEFTVDDDEERCGIVRVHLEEDTGKSIHETTDGRDVTLIDFNRSGIPLMEIVSEPELRSPVAAREYFATLRQILMYLGVSDGNLQEGSLRADVNVSLRGQDGAFGTKVEIKNLNSFRAVQRALEYEIERQRTVIESGGVIEQETRGWQEKEEVTVSQRSKEYAHDYRYFPEPDLPPLVLASSWIETLRGRIPELAKERQKRFEVQFQLSTSASKVLTEERSRAEFYEDAIRAAHYAAPRAMANWLIGDVLRLVNEHDNDLSDSCLTPTNLASLVDLVESGAISGSAGKQVLEVIFASGEHAEDVARRLDLMKIADPAALEALVDQALAANTRMVEDYKRGKSNVVNALRGEIMKVSGGKADLQLAGEILGRKLGELLG